MRGGALLEFAVLGLLRENPMHGYQLRKRLSVLFGPFRALSYGSLYPTLKRMKLQDWITENAPVDSLVTRRAKRVYSLSHQGEEELARRLNDTQAIHADSEGFGVHLAFFSLTPASTRIRILENRRNIVESKREHIQHSLASKPTARESYSQGLKQLELESAERELTWLNRIIAREYNAISDSNPDPDSLASLSELRPEIATNHSSNNNY